MNDIWASVVKVAAAPAVMCFRQKLKRKNQEIHCWGKNADKQSCHRAAAARTQEHSHKKDNFLTAANEQPKGFAAKCFRNFNT